VVLAAGCGFVENQRSAPEYRFSDLPAWSQNFGGMADGTPDRSIWHYELDPAVPGYNDEIQAYTDDSDNVRIENGHLVIEALRETHSYPNDPQQQEYAFTSGRIDTHGSLEFEYGKFEVTMKLPEGQGTWPAVWFLSANQPHTQRLHPDASKWEEERFYMHDGELDLVEAYGHSPGKIESTLHAYNRSIEIPVEIPDAATSFHTYGTEITPEKVTLTLDGAPFKVLEKTSGHPDDWPFGNGNKWYAIFNLALGGPAGIPDAAENSWRMEVASINFYPYVKK
jgi:beta-glucanase (GH16 family)